MLFVFGRRAQQLRHKKIAGLIHKSAAIPDAEYARVAVHFVECREGHDAVGVPRAPCWLALY